MFILRDSSALQIEQSIHGALAVPQDATQFPSSLIPGAEYLPKGDGLTGEFRADGAAQELVFVEDTDLCHIPRVDSQSDRFPNIRRQRCGDVTETLEVNPIGPHLARFGYLDQEQVQLFQRVRHPGQKAVRLPTLDRRRFCFCILSPMVHVEQEGAKQCIELC
jgi:hypothetical protein